MTNQVFPQPDRHLARHERFMNLAVPVRLGELAESLLFAAVDPDYPHYSKIAGQFLNESARFIDWTFADVEPAVQSELAELRAQLSEWLCDLQAIEGSLVERASVTAALKEWSQIILDRSGLAEYDDWQVEFDYPPGIRAAAEALV